MIGTDSLGSSANILNLLSAKQQVISENLANMHTPGYKKKNINFSQVLANGNNSLETKLSQKLGPSPISVTESGEVAPADELMEMQKVQLYYTVATRQMTSVIQQLKQVAQAGR
ncbi:MAG: flagellar basal body protein [Candidatus Gastranaerophilales bacterium]|nr:flagellar basal body protein [Candidatus Gastranaerophilales bacterium]